MNNKANILPFPRMCIKVVTSVVKVLFGLLLIVDSLVLFNIECIWEGVIFCGAGVLLVGLTLCDIIR